MTILNAVTRLKKWIDTLILNTDKKIFFFLLILFLVTVITNVCYNRYSPISTYSIDPAWEYSIINFPYNTDFTFGKDVLFTYGPLAPYLLVQAYDTIHPFIHYLISSAFFISNLLIVFFYLYKVIKKAGISKWQYILFLPFLIWLGPLKITSYEILIFIFMFIFILYHDKLIISRIESILFGILSAIFILFKFNYGVYYFLFFLMMYLLSLHHVKRRIHNVSNFVLYLVVFLFSLTLIFCISTKSLDLYHYIFYSIKILLDYKEYMAYSALTPGQLFSSLVLLPGILFPIFYVKRKILIVYLFLIYIALTYGWIRNDAAHMFPTNSFIFFIICFSSAIFFSKLKNKKLLNFTLLTASIIFIVLGYFQFKAYNINILQFDFSGDLSYLLPIYNKSIELQKENDFELTRQSFSQEYQDDLRNSKRLLVIPWAIHLPSEFGVESIYLPILQQYHNFINEADDLSIQTLNQNYNETSVLVHDGALDNRLFLSENPMFTLTILKNYSMKNYNETSILLYPKFQSLSEIKCSQVPEFSSANLIKIKLKKSILEELKSFLYKHQEICINYHDNEGVFRTNRTYYKQLERGILVTPLLTDTNDIKDFYLGKPIKKMQDITITYCNNQRELTKESELLFYCQ